MAQSFSIYSVYISKFFSATFLSSLMAVTSAGVLLDKSGSGGSGVGGGRSFLSLPLPPTPPMRGRVQTVS